MQLLPVEKVLVIYMSAGAALLMGVLYLISAFYQVKFEKPTPSDLFLVSASMMVVAGVGLTFDSINIWPLIIGAVGALICLFASLRLYGIMMR